MTLDADTEIERVAGGRWRGEVSEDWWIERGPFGGYVSALAMRALLAELDDPGRPPQSLTVHFIDAPVAGPIDVAVAIERAGRSSTALSLRLEQGGRPIALGLAGASVWRFFAQGMLLNVTQSLDLESIADTSEWAAAWCEGIPLQEG